MANKFIYLFGCDPDNRDSNSGKGNNFFSFPARPELRRYLPIFVPKE